METVYYVEGSPLMFYILTILLMIVMVAIAIGPIVIGILFLKWLIKKSNQRNEEMRQQAYQMHEDKTKIEEEKLAIKKRKYQRTRCKYCGSLNKIDAKHCTQCGGPLTGKNAMDEYKEEQKASDVE